MAIATSLLALQIVGALEYTEGGSWYAQASMIAAMLTLALLPVFIVAALKVRAKLLALVLLIAFAAFLSYTLPATIGRTGEVKEVKVLVAKKSVDDLARIASDFDKSKGLVSEAQAWVASECRTGNGGKCKGVTFILEQRTAYADKLRKTIEDQQPAKTGDIGSDTVSWALAWAGVPAEIVRRWSVLTFGLGLDIVIWALFWFGANERLRNRIKQPRIVTVRPSRPASKVDEAEHRIRQVWPDTSTLPPVREAMRVTDCSHGTTARALKRLR